MPTKVDGTAYPHAAEKCRGAWYRVRILTLTRGIGLMDIGFPSLPSGGGGCGGTWVVIREEVASEDERRGFIVVFTSGIW